MANLHINISEDQDLVIPREVLAKAHLQGEVEVAVQNNSVVVRSTESPRAGWAEAARLTAKRKDDQLLDQPTATRWDETEWQW